MQCSGPTPIAHGRCVLSGTMLRAYGNSQEDIFHTPRYSTASPLRNNNSNLGRVRRNPHVGGCALPLRVLSVQCAHRPTDGLGEKLVTSAYAVLIERDALIIL